MKDSQTWILPKCQTLFSSLALGRLTQSFKGTGRSLWLTGLRWSSAEVLTQSNMPVKIFLLSCWGMEGYKMNLVKWRQTDKVSHVFKTRWILLCCFAKRHVWKSCWIFATRQHRYNLYGIYEIFMWCIWLTYVHCMCRNVEIKQSLTAPFKQLCLSRIL